MTGLAPRRVLRFAHTSRGEPISAQVAHLQAAVSRDWAWGGTTGRGVRVGVIDSGIDGTHPAVGDGVRMLRVASSTTEARYTVEPDDVGDVAGHGTACAGIVRALAPDCELISIRVLGDRLRGSGEALVAALEWSVDEGIDVVNLSLSTRKPVLKECLHDLVERAYFAGTTIVSSAHNSPVESYPWRFASVISVGSHDHPDADYIEASPNPPVDFFACGVGVSVAWLDGRTTRVTGNSFATPHITGLCARILERHPGFRTTQLRQTLMSVADNVE